MGEEVGLLDAQDGDAAAFGCFGGQRVAGLRDQGGVVEAGPPAERGDDVVVDAARGDGGVGEVDQVVAGGFGALEGDAALPSATRQTDLPRVDVGQVDVRHVDVRDDVVDLVEVRDVIVDVAGHARDVDVIKGCVMDGRRAELDIRWTRDQGGKNRRCGGGSGRENRCEIDPFNSHGSRPSDGPKLDQRNWNCAPGAWVYWQRALKSTKG